MNSSAGEQKASDHPPMETLLAFASGSLSKQESLNIEGHLDTCADCCEILNTSVDPRDTLIEAIRASQPSSATMPLRTQPGFELLEMVGRGGMAIVWKARQVSLGRVVALKQIRSGSLAEGAELARFRRESDAVSRLVHPHIVQVYDAGEQDGQPYLAMEYLSGGTLADRLTAGPLDPQDAGQLVSLLAGAMDYAHHQSVIHRDLKPANILFSTPWRTSSAALAAADCIPKIADFGLAKLIDENTTRTGILAGTPSYMAPEQTIDSGTASPGSDVYALGAILYECLTNRPPFRGGSILETMDQVRHFDPVPPRQLRPSLPRDLETICLKCLSKQPRHRYASAADLAADLNLFRAGRAITARRVGPFSRASQWIVRNPIISLLIAMCSLAGSAAVGVGVAYDLQLRRAFNQTKQQRQAALQQRQRADENFAQAFGAVAKLLDEVGSAVLDDVPEMEQTRERLIQDAIDFYELLLDDRGNPDEMMRRVHAGAYQRLARAQLSLSNYLQAEQAAVKAIELASDLRSSAPQELTLQAATGGSPALDIGIAHLVLASARSGLGKSLDARASAAEAIKSLQALTSDSPVARLELSRAYSEMARTVDFDQRESWHLKAIAELELLATTGPTVPRDSSTILWHETCQDAMAFATYNLALWYRESGRKEQATNYYQRSVELLEPLARQHPNAGRIQSHLADALTAMAHLAFERQDISIADELMQRSVGIRQHLVALFPKLVSRQEDYARSLHNRADIFRQSGRPTEATQDFLRAIETRQAMLEDNPTLLLTRDHLAGTWNNLGLCYVDLKRDDMACEAFQKSIELQQVSSDGSDDADDSLSSHVLAATLINYAAALQRQGRLADARARHDQSVDLMQRLWMTSAQSTYIRQNLLNALGARAQTLMSAGEYRDAVMDWQRSLELTGNQDRLWYSMVYAETLARASEIKRAVEVLQSLHQHPDLSGTDQFSLACIYAIAAKAPGDLSAVASEEAMRWLQKAEKAGVFANAELVQQVRTDEDFQCLWAREDFQLWFSELTADR